MPLNVLVVGAGVGGPAFASLLQGSDPRHNITVIERAPSIRNAGQQIDFKDHGETIIRRMGLMDIAKTHLVAETGMDFVDESGKPYVHLGVNDGRTDESQIAITSEYEIMRGDLVQVLFEASRRQRATLGDAGSLTYEFEKTVVGLTQRGDGVDVTFSDGQKRHYDLVVGADGQGSRIRRLAFGQEASDAAFRPLGAHAAFYSMPRVDGETNLAKMYLTTGRRAVGLRTGDRPVTQVYLFSMNIPTQGRQDTKEPSSVEKQKEVWQGAFQDAGWKADQLLRGLKASTDFYTCELGQVKMPQWHTGRVVLLGDAGYCPSLMTGMGTTSALVGAYILAGELARHGEKGLATALDAHDKKMRPFVLQYQRLPFGGYLGTVWPSTRLGLWLFRTIFSAITNSRIAQTIHRVLPADKNRERGTLPLPDYPELKLGA